MDKKTAFKSFVREHPEFSDFVNQNETTWQKLYEMYDLYGEDSKVWNRYFKKDNNIDLSGIKDTIKNIDLDKLQESITNAKKTLGIISALVGTKASNIAANTNPGVKSDNLNSLFGDQNGSINH